MKELMQRLARSPHMTAELLVATLFANILALAGPLFVMQVLNRYVANGVDSTLFTLVSGVLIAVVLEYIFRQTRMKIARTICVLPDEVAAFKGFAILTRGKASELDKIPPENRREMVNGVQAIETAYNANNISTVLDVPFAFVFIVVLYMLSPTIALIVSCFTVGSFLIGVYGSRSMKPKTVAAQEISGIGSSLVSTATRESDTIRAFNAGGFLRRAWRHHQGQVQQLRRDITARQGTIQTITQSTNGLMSVAVIGIGALMVVSGNMDVGAMIGGNILASRALQPISKFSQLGSAFAKAREAMEMFAKLDDIPLEAEKGSALTHFNGKIEFRDLSFSYEGSNTPLFESLNLSVKPGSVLVVTGNNGTGKTTFARLLMGLLEPTRGQILIDGLDLQQLTPEWWRRQPIYLPQEPTLLNATIEENLRVNAPDISMDALNEAVNTAGLRRFLDESPHGMDTMIVDNGWRLSEGIRRRMALARAVCSEATIAIIDEPTESLDSEGSAAVHAVLGEMAKKGRTIIIMSHDANMVNGPHTVIDLTEKPSPKITQAGTAPTQAPPAQPEPKQQQPQQQEPTKLAQAEKPAEGIEQVSLSDIRDNTGDQA